MTKKLIKQLVKTNIEPVIDYQDTGGGCTVVRATDKVIIKKEVLDTLVELAIKNIG